MENRSDKLLKSGLALRLFDEMEGKGKVVDGKVYFSAGTIVEAFDKFFDKYAERIREKDALTIDNLKQQVESLKKQIR